MNNKLHYGIVKWFGGHNSKTNKENDFGFLQDFSGEDIYLHKKSLKGEKIPTEGDVLVYEIEKCNKKPRAINAENLLHSEISCQTIFDALLQTKKNNNIFSTRILQQSLADILFRKIQKAELREIREIANESNRNYAYELLCMHCGPNASTGNRSRWVDIFTLLSTNSEINIFKDLPWHLIPPTIFSNQEEALTSFIESIDQKDAREKCIKKINDFPVSFIFYLAIKNIFTTKDDVSSRLADLEKYIYSLYKNPSQELPNYVKNAYERHLKPIGGYRSAPIIWEIIEPLLFKQYLFEKKEKIFDIYNASNLLKRKIDTFILFNIFSLHYCHNNTETIYNIFKQKLWEAINFGDIDIQEQSSKILELFPSCHTFDKKPRYKSIFKNLISLGLMDHNEIESPKTASTEASKEFYCEAVFWEKSEIYLCRGKKCLDPQVIPNTDKHFLEFNIYDWFAHYGINYFKENKPSNKDFPIKLAGYFNRLNEIFSVIHCRACSKLMTPNFHYARTEYQDFENGKFVTKDMAASYRVTVFHCNNNDCIEYEIGYYISHCIGCDKIIDARDLKIKCDAGRYVCKGCGGCCETHAKSNPVGLCSQCGDHLQLFEKSESNYFGKKLRWVKCGSSCGFSISSDNLPQKFYLPSCQPVYKDKN